MDSLKYLNMITNKDYVETAYIKNLAERAMLYIKAGFPLHLRGVSGVGKTALAFHIAGKMGRPIIFMCGNEDFSDVDLVGGYFGLKKSVMIDNYISSVYKKQEETKRTWQDGRLITACKNGYTLIYDEFTRARPESNNMLLSVLEERIIEIPGGSSNEEYIKIHPDFRAIFTSNPEEYAGVFKSPNALIDRMITVDIDVMDLETEKAIIISQSKISSKDAEIIAEITRNLRMSGIENHWASLRSSIMLAKVVKENNIKLDAKNIILRKICKDIYSSSNINSGLNPAERENYAQIIDRVLDTVLGSST